VFRCSSFGSKSFGWCIASRGFCIMQADRSRAFRKPQSRLPETAVAATKAKDGDVTVADLVVAMMAQGDVTVAEIVQPDSQPASKAASLWALLLFGQQPMANQVGGSVRYATTSQWSKTVLLVANLRRRVLANVHAGDTQICPTTRRSGGGCFIGRGGCYTQICPRWVFHRKKSCQISSIRRRQRKLQKIRSRGKMCAEAESQAHKTS